ncbi:MAG: SPFH domain-containing protein, partial [Clostridia bacterium]|nr:SPFH domain-containing protein [Clostridia bacterium]
MGIFNFFKKQLLKVVEWEDDSKDTIVYRYPLEDRDELMTSSTLVVRESQCAIFMHKGEIADVFGPGTYKLSTENIPFLTKLLSLPAGFESRIKAEIYYVNTKQFIGQKWGTQNPIMMRDDEFGNVRIRGFGVYSFRVTDAKKFMKEIFGTNAVYTVDDVAEQLKPMLIQGITDTLAEAKISALDLAANYREFAGSVMETCQKEFDEYGLSLTKFVIENISLPEEVEA